MSISLRKTGKVAALAVTAVLIGGALGATTVPMAATAVDGSALPTCSTTFHDSFQATAQDGSKYPTWHPATATDPDTGVECSFGHEHGDDPSTSNIAAWTVEKLGGSATGITFGFAAHMSMMVEGAPHRHEDHYGHKVFVLNNVNLVREDREGYVTAADGTPVTCDYLIYTHQGSHSKDALSNNQHEMLYSTKCNDGTEMVVNTLTGYGNANEYTANCDLRTVTTGGSALPNGTGGGREIPDVQCVQQTAGQFWGPYELWKSDHTIAAESGEALVRFDPWFGVRNPSRVGGGSDALATVSLADASWTTWPWSPMTEGVQKEDPASPFDGAQRDVYVQHSTLNNASGSTTVYTDAYGQRASSVPFDGAITQYVGAVSNADQAESERVASGFSTDYGSGNGVHASN